MSENHEQTKEWWGDGSSLYDVSLCECVLGPQVPKLIVHGDTMSLGLIHPCHLVTSMYCIMKIMTGMYQSRDIVFLVRLI